MVKFDKNLVLSAVKDAFLNGSYDEYSISDGWTLVRNDDVECWEDEGFSLLSDDDETCYSYCVEAFCTEEEWFFEKGKVLEKMVDYVYEMINN